MTNPQWRSVRRVSAGLIVAVAAAFACTQSSQPGLRSQLRFAVSFPTELSATALDGRVLLVISTDESREPRFQVSDGTSGSPFLDTQLIFGVDIDGLKPADEAIIDASVLGYPLDSLADIPAGTYQVQAVLHKYETLHRADGHTIKVPMDRGEGQKWNRAPGNLYSTPRKIAIDPKKGGVIRVALDKVIPSIPDPQDTKYVKYVKIQSERLTKFWGRPTHLGAIVLLPEGFDEHPNAHYPLMINHGHFMRELRGFRETPPEPGLQEREKAAAERAYQFYKDWTGPKFPRMLMLTIQHANPYFDDSYAVNSANMGPYGDAITYELLPYIEKKFRGIGQGWARGMYGGSTGGWEVMGAQVMYPEEYNGAWAACPDPQDFRAFGRVNIYEDKNAYWTEGTWRKIPRSGLQDSQGRIRTLLVDMNRLELVLGTKGRSGGAWDAYQAVFTPVGDDGYPKPIWDKRTGVIDHTVAQYWREHYDITYILRRDWEKGLGQKLRGKIHIHIGDMDDWHSNDAVYLIEEFLKSTKNPPYDGEIHYGDRAGHCWSGHGAQYWFTSLESRISATAPKGADTTSWRY